MNFLFFVYKIRDTLLLGGYGTQKEGPYMKQNKTLDVIAFVLLIIGGLCWGLIGAFNYEPISMILGGGDMMHPFVRFVYVLVGLAALYRLYVWFASRK